MLIVNAQDIVRWSPAAERPGGLSPRPGAIVVSRVTRASPRDLPGDPKGWRGRIVDILV